MSKSSDSEGEEWQEMDDQETSSISGIEQPPTPVASRPRTKKRSRCGSPSSRDSSPVNAKRNATNTSGKGSKKDSSQREEKKKAKPKAKPKPKERKWGANAGPPRRPLTNEEVKALLTACDAQLASKRNRALITMLLHCGLRISEALSLNVKDVVDTSGEMKSRLTVTAANSKGKKAQTVVMHPDVIQALKPIVEGVDRKEPLFRNREKNTRLTRGSVWGLLKGLAKAAKLPDADLISAHSFRKSYAKELYEQSGKDLVFCQAAMRHQNIDSTRRYLNVRRDEIDGGILGMKSVFSEEVKSN